MTTKMCCYKGRNHMMPVECFSAQLNMLSGRSSWCKECTKEYQTDRRQAAGQAPRPSAPDVPEATSTTPQCLYVPDTPSTTLQSLYVMTISTDPDGRQFGVKIGRANNPSERAKQLETSMPFHVDVRHESRFLGYLEDQVHGYLANSRNTDGRGREWFRAVSYTHLTLPTIYSV